MPLMESLISSYKNAKQGSAEHKSIVLEHKSAGIYNKKTSIGILLKH